MCHKNFEQLGRCFTAKQFIPIFHIGFKMGEPSKYLLGLREPPDNMNKINSSEYIRVVVIRKNVSYIAGHREECQPYRQLKRSLMSTDPSGTNSSV
uniref:Uncharacterized protein n=1 Tax=Pyxicephalus adspersus TaxID=30357 RepID=A0AAV3AY49_PYXAD|nr:TPA: hypothetical protein GDO54_011289 [Pyxicephalus adspersus]